jgi:hypothetical protein
MACLSLLSRASWRSSDSSAPFPKGLVMEAWKARVGNSRDRWCNQRRVTQAGTCGDTRWWWVLESEEGKTLVSTLHDWLFVARTDKDGQFQKDVIVGG